jgi:hypothetical protein
MRDEVLSTTVNDFKDFASRLNKIKEDGVSVVFGSQAALEQANNQIEDENNKFVLEPAFTDNTSG